MRGFPLVFSSILICKSLPLLLTNWPLIHILFSINTASRTCCWSNMERLFEDDGTCGDNINLQRACDILDVHFILLSALGLDTTSVISPSSSHGESLPLLLVVILISNTRFYLTRLDQTLELYCPQSGTSPLDGSA